MIIHLQFYKIPSKLTRAHFSWHDTSTHGHRTIIRLDLIGTEVKAIRPVDRSHHIVTRTKYTCINNLCRQSNQATTRLYLVPSEGNMRRQPVDTPLYFVWWNLLRSQVISMSHEYILSNGFFLYASLYTSAIAYQMMHAACWYL